MPLLDYAEVDQNVRDAGKASLLLGNGFSIALDRRFDYTSLFELAKKNGLSDTSTKLFERVGGSDFEGTLRLLDDGEWVAKLYGTEEVDLAALRSDHEAIRHALVEAIKDSHLENSRCLASSKKKRAREFLSPYDSVFTTSYDLLLYWVAMSMEEPLRDGFSRPADDLVFVGWDDDNSAQMLHLHGALHFYWSHNGLMKHSWSDVGRPLKELITAGIGDGQYPHFVAEGHSATKLAKIRSSPYLDACYRRLRTVGPVLVALGFSFADNDNHLATAVAQSPGLQSLYVGLHGNEESEGNLAIKSRVTRAASRRDSDYGNLTVSYFDSGSAHVWTAPEDS